MIEKRYERWVNHQTKIRTRRKCDGIKAVEYARLSDRRAGRPVYFPIRYADDFVVLVSGSYEDALSEKEALENRLRQTTGLELSPEKTKISVVSDSLCTGHSRFHDAFSSQGEEGRRFSKTMAN